MTDSMIRISDDSFAHQKIQTQIDDAMMAQVQPSLV